MEIRGDKWIHGWMMKGHMDGRMNGLIDEGKWVDGGMDGRIDV